MARTPKLTEEIVLHYLDQNRTFLSVEELLDRIQKGEGWVTSPSVESLRQILNDRSSSIKKRVQRVEGETPRYGLISQEDRGFSKERDLDRPLATWLKNQMDIEATPLAPGGAAGGGEKGSNTWRYPDLVGLKHYSDLPGSLVHFFKTMNTSYMEISSFEVKQDITTRNVREYFFQCLANSAWANRRYLVAATITPEAFTEFRKLSNLYGMGLIRIVVGREGGVIVPVEEESQLIIDSPRCNLDVQTVRDFYEKQEWRPFREWMDRIK